MLKYFSEILKFNRKRTSSPILVEFNDTLFKDFSRYLKTCGNCSSANKSAHTRARARTFFWKCDFSILGRSEHIVIENWEKNFFFLNKAFSVGKQRTLCFIWQRILQCKASQSPELPSAYFRICVKAKYQSRSYYFMRKKYST